MAIETRDGQIMIPANAAAEEVRRRREENVDIDEQMRILRRKQLENSELIGTLLAHAVWAPSGESVESPAEGEDQPAPEPEETPDPETGPQPDTEVEE